MQERYGLGKKRSKLGKFLDKNNITQELIGNSSRISRHAISLLCNSRTNINPTENTQVKIIGTLRRLGYDVSFTDFWD